MSEYMDIFFRLMDSGYSLESLRSLSNASLQSLPSSDQLPKLLASLSSLVAAGYDADTLGEMCDPKLAFILKATTGKQYNNVDNPLLQQAMVNEFANFVGVPLADIPQFARSESAVASAPSSIETKGSEVAVVTTPESNKPSQDGDGMMVSDVNTDKESLSSHKKEGGIMPRLGASPFMN
jgi:hypothetical protein